jgi:hypothetical protein
MREFGLVERGKRRIFGARWPDSYSHARWTGIAAGERASRRGRGETALPDDLLGRVDQQPGYGFGVIFTTIAVKLWPGSITN